MQQLLTLTNQADFMSAKSSSTSELELQGASGSGQSSSEFSQALLAGMQQQSTPSKMTRAMVKTTESAELSQGQRIKRLDFDDSNVGKPVEAPILDLLEEMQSLLVDTAEQSGADTEAESVDAEQSTDESAETILAKLGVSEEDIAHVADMLEQLGAKDLSEEQRQQLATEFMAALNPKQQQLMAEFDIEQSALGSGKDAIDRIMAEVRDAVPLNTNADDTDKSGSATDTAIDSEDNKVALLSRLQQLAQLANAAVTAANRDAQAEVEGESGLAGEASSLDESPMAWLRQQLAQLTATSATDETSAAQQQPALTDKQVIAQLQQLLTQAQQGGSNQQSLSAEQQQQLQTMMQQLQQAMATNQAGDSTVEAKIASHAGGEVLAELKQLVNQWRQPAATNNAETDEKVAVNQPTAPMHTKADKSAVTAEPVTANGQDKVASKAADAAVMDDLSGEPNREKNQSRNGADALLNSLVNGNHSSVTRDSGSTSFAESLINAQNAPVSTQAGSMKASESSSTLQSLMQAIQKPFDPQQVEASQKMQERINLMLSRNIQRADIRLDPPDLGHVHVRINMSSDQASVQFQVQSQQARDAVEQAMPRLKEMLEQQGVMLADTDVREQQQQASQQGEGGSAQASGGFAGEEVEQHQVALDGGKPLSLGGVDFYV